MSEDPKDEIYEENYRQYLREQTDKILQTNKNQQIRQYLQMMRNLIQENLVKDNKIASLTKVEKDFFLNEIFPQIIDNMHQFQQFSQLEPETLANLDSLLKEYLLLIQFGISEDHIKCSEIFQTYFDNSRPYFKYHPQYEESNEIYFNTFLYSDVFPNGEKEYSDWFNNLQVGTIVDAVKCGDEIFIKKVWSKARVIGVAEENKIKIQFLNEPENYAIKIKQKKNLELMPENTRCFDHEWRMGLNVGDEVDGEDHLNIWYNCTVLESHTQNPDEKPENRVQMIQIGFRVYRQDGDRQDEEKKKQFFGWGSTYDEWFSVTSARIHKLGRVAQKCCRNANSEPFIEDTTDFLYEQAYQRDQFAALIRPSQTKSTHYVDCINFFYSIGGFNAILERMQDETNFIPLELLSNYIGGFSNMHGSLYRHYCYEIVPRIFKAVRQLLIEAPDQFIRLMEKEKIDKILYGLKNLFMRTYSLTEKYKFIEEISFQIVIKLLNSPFLNQQIVGIKMLTELITKVSTTLQYFDATDISNWITRHNIFDTLYNKSAHLQLMQRSGDFLRFMLNEDLLTTDHLSQIWVNILKSHQETKQAIFQILYDVSQCMKEIHIIYLTDEIEKIPSDELLPDHVELVFQLFRFQRKESQSLLQKGLNLLFRLIFDQTQKVSPVILEQSLAHFSFLVKHLPSNQNQIKIIVGCVDNLQLNKEVSSSIMIIQKIIENLPITKSEIQENITKEYVCQLICQEHGLVDSVLSNLSLLKVQYLQLLQEALGNQLTQIKNEAKSIEKSTKEKNSNSATSIVLKKYNEKLTERINFLKFINGLLGVEKKIIGFNFLCSIWDQVVSSPLGGAQRDLTFKWLRELSQTSENSLLEVLKFFREKLLQSENFTRELSTEGFQSFQSLFLTINEQQNYLIKRESKKSLKQQVISISSTGETGYAKDTEDADKSQGIFDFEYDVMVNPDQLEGMKLLWNTIRGANNDNVVRKAVDFVTKLSLNTSSTIERQQLKEIRKGYLFHLLEQFQQSQLQLKQTDEKDQTKVQNQSVELEIQRTIQVLLQYLAESEQRGIGSQQSHIGLVKGESCSLVINNEITEGKDIPKKLDLKISSSKTVLELRLEIAQQLGTSWDQVKLRRSNLLNKQIYDSENGQTIQEIRFKSNEVLVAQKRAVSPIPQIALVDESGAMVPRLFAIVKTWYKKFADAEGRMNPEGCANFIDSCTHDSCKPNDDRVQGLFKEFDDDNDGFLSEKNFISFYSDAAKNKNDIVWRNLVAHYYRNDLIKETQVPLDTIDEYTMPRYILMNDLSQIYEILFNLLRECSDDLCQEIWNLLGRLPPSPEIMKQIITLEGVAGIDPQQANWKSVLDQKDSFQMLYVLTIIQYLMEQGDQEESVSDEAALKKSELTDDQKNEELQIEKIENKDQLLNNSYWRQDFIKYGGFEQLFRIFQHLVKNDVFSMTIIEQNTLAFILKIMRNYLTATLALYVPHIYQIVSYTRLIHYTLQNIDENLKDAENDQIVSEPNDKNGSNQSSNQDDQNKQQTGSAATGNASNWVAPQIQIKETKDFLLLVEKLKTGDLGKKILDTLDLKGLKTELIVMIKNILDKDIEIELEDRNLVDFGICILIAVLSYSEETKQAFLKDQSSRAFILKGLFYRGNGNVRKFFSHGFYLLARGVQGYHSLINIGDWLLNFLIQSVPNSLDETKKDCGEYYNILCQMIQESNGKKEENIDFRNLLNTIIQNIKQHQSTERRNQNKNDQIFHGYISLVEKLFTIRPEFVKLNGTQFIRFIFNSCLFCMNPEELFDIHFKSEMVRDDNLDFTPPDYVKTKTSDSRRVAYRLLIKMINADFHVLEYLMNECLIPLSDKIPIPNSWNYKPSMEGRSFYGYAGIKNLGCICYMNAMMQQFFMTPTFRYALLASDDQKAENLVEYKSRQIDDNILHQVQQLFAYLQMSDRISYDPTEFCFSFQDYTGMPTNVSIQQDAQEFLNMIFEKLENGLQETPFQYILQGVYGGQTCTQIICSNCQNSSEREELFYTITTPVQNCKSLNESFQKYIEGQSIEDYQCENCKQSCDQTKRTCLSKLPNILIVQLQRIVFNLDKMINEKINTKLEFPMNINMEPFTRQHLNKADNEKKKKSSQSTSISVDKEQAMIPQMTSKISGQDDIKEEHTQDYYNYKLKGIVVHQGTAEYGHYYSYINHKADKWLQYDDAVIRDFNVNNIQAECFGGESSMSSNDDWWAKGETSKNAYILVYERVSKENLRYLVQDQKDLEFLEKELKVKLVNEVKFDKNREKEIKPNAETALVDYFSFGRSLRKNHFRQTWLDNHKFMFEKHIYHEDFFNFLKEIVYNLKYPADYEDLVDMSNPNSVIINIYPKYKDIDPELRQSYVSVLNVTSKMMFDIIARANDNDVLRPMMIQMKKLLNLVPEYAFEFWRNNFGLQAKRFLEIQTTCPDTYVRFLMAHLCAYSLNVTLAVKQVNLFAQIEKDANLDTYPEADRLGKQIADFLDFILSFLNTEVAQNWHQAGGYFEFWRDFHFNGGIQMDFCHQRDLIGRFIDFYIGKSSTVQCFGEKKHETGNRHSKAPLDALVQLIGNMIAQYRSISNYVSPQVLQNPEYKLYQLSDPAKLGLLNPQFYIRAVSAVETHDPVHLSSIVGHLSVDNEIYSQFICTLILANLNQSNYSDCETFLILLEKIMAISDNLVLKRIQWIFGIPMVVQNAEDGYESTGCLEDAVITYESTIGIDAPQSLLTYIYRVRGVTELYVISILRYLLPIIRHSPFLIHHLAFLPPPAYLYAKYTDWIQPFLLQYYNDPLNMSSNYHSTIPKQKWLKDCLNEIDLVDAVLNEKIQSCKPQKEEVKNSDSQSSIEEEQQMVQGEQKEIEKPQPLAPPKIQLLQSFSDNYIIGQNQIVEKISQEILGQKNGQTIFITCYQHYVNLAISLPVGNRNLIVPDAVFSLDRGVNIDFSMINQEASSIMKLFKPSGTNTKFKQMYGSVMAAGVNQALALQNEQNKKNNEQIIKVEEETTDIMPIGMDTNIEAPKEGTSDSEVENEVGFDQLADILFNENHIKSENKQDFFTVSPDNSPKNNNSQVLDQKMFDPLPQTPEKKSNEKSPITQEGLNQQRQEELPVTQNFEIPKIVVNPVEKMGSEDQMEVADENQSDTKANVLPESHIKNEPIVAEIPKIIVDADIFAEPMIRRFVITNNTLDKVKVQFSIDSAERYFFPAGELIQTIKPKSSETIFSIRQYHHTQDWGDYNTNTFIEFSSTSSNSNSNQNQKGGNSEPEKTQNNNNSQNESAPNQKTTFQGADIIIEDESVVSSSDANNNTSSKEIGPKNLDPKDEFIDFFPEEINCPHCTSYNDATNAFCIVCGQDIKK